MKLRKMSKNEQESKVEQSSVVHFLEKVICKTNKQNFPNFPKSPSFTWTQQPVQNHFLTQTTFEMTESYQLSVKMITRLKVVNQNFKFKIEIMKILN